MSKRTEIQEGLTEWLEGLAEAEAAYQDSLDCRCCCCTGECYNDSYEGEFPY